METITLQLGTLEGVIALIIFIGSFGIAWGSLKNDVGHIKENLTEIKSQVNLIEKRLANIELNVSGFHRRITSLEKNAGTSSPPQKSDGMMLYDKEERFSYQRSIPKNRSLVLIKNT